MTIPIWQGGYLGRFWNADKGGNGWNGNLWREGYIRVIVKP